MIETNRSIFEKWAPAASPWSDWAKPTLFISHAMIISSQLPDLPPCQRPVDLDKSWGAVIDMPRENSVLYGLAMARAGFRPIPLFNGCDGPSPAIDMIPIIRMLRAGADSAILSQLDENAPPAFLVDSKRKTANAAILPGIFDNRWICLPQDFPSATFLKDHGIQKIAMIRNEAQLPDVDLLHILRRWQEGGLPIHQWIPESNASLQLVEIPRPKNYRSIWYAILARIGFRSNYVGGFGSVVPQPSQG
jgi:hypothetical protein